MPASPTFTKWTWLFCIPVNTKTMHYLEQLQQWLLPLVDFVLGLSFIKPGKVLFTQMLLRGWFGTIMYLPRGLLGLV